MSALPALDIRSSRKHHGFVALCGMGFLACAASSGQAQVLSTWTFNNIANTGAGGTNSSQNNADVGSFSTAAAPYGEAYNPGNQNGNNQNTSTLSSNTAGIFHGSNVHIDFSPFYITYGGDANGGYAHDDVFGAGFDAATGTSVANSAGGIGGAGSLFLGNGVGTNLDIDLQSTGYTNLTLSFQVASITSDDNNTPFNGFDTIQPEYSTNGSAFTNLGSRIVVSGAFADQGLESIALPTALENQASFVVRLNLNYENAGGNNQRNIIEIDNLTLTAAPEPSTWAALMVGVGVLSGVALRRRLSARQVA